MFNGSLCSTHVQSVQHLDYMKLFSLLATQGERFIQNKQQADNTTLHREVENTVVYNRPTATAVFFQELFHNLLIVVMFMGYITECVWMFAIVNSRQ